MSVCTKLQLLEIHLPSEFKFTIWHILKLQNCHNLKLEFVFPLCYLGSLGDISIHLECWNSPTQWILIYDMTYIKCTKLSLSEIWICFFSVLSRVTRRYIHPLWMLYPTVPVSENTCKGHLPNVLMFVEVTCKMETARIIACVTLLKQNW